MVGVTVEQAADAVAAARPPRSWRELPLEQKHELLLELQRRRRAKVLERWPTPGALAQALDHTTRNPPHLRLLDEALVDVAEGRCKRLMVIMPPQEGKSERTSHFGALWQLLLDPDMRIAIASYELETARRWGMVIRNDLVTYRLPLRLSEDARAAGRWNVDGHRGGVYCVGIGGALTGRPVDFLLIDDPVKDRAQADSEPARKAAWDWWTDVGRTRLAPNAPVILIMTRWHEDDLGGRILASEGGSEWRVIRIPAQADHRPEKGETDPIGREPGEFLPSARQWEPGRWEGVRRDVGSRSWNALYQGKPSPPEGGILRRAWWQRYAQPLWEVRDDGSRWVHGTGVEVIQSWDMAFKDTKGSDFVVGQVWAKAQNQAYLLDQVRDRLDFTATLKAVQALTVKWPQARTKLVEDKANGTAVINALKQGTGYGLIPVSPKESKEARASAVAPVVEGGQVWVPSHLVAPFGDELVEEAAVFPNGSHDDQVDACSQALQRLFLERRSRVL